MFIKRDDLIHPIISGNKWRKLKGNLAEAKRQNKKGLLALVGLIQIIFMRWLMPVININYHP